MLKSKKTILGIILCAIMTLCFSVSATFVKPTKVYADDIESVYVEYKGHSRLDIVEDFSDLDSIGLDYDWSFIGDKGGYRDYPYYSSDGVLYLKGSGTSNKNFVTVTALDGQSILSIALSFSNSTYDQAVVSVNGEEVTGDGDYRNMNYLFSGGCDSFTITRGSRDVQISSFRINYLQEQTPQKELVSLAILGAPTKTEYKVGETFNTDGLTVQATYSDASTGDVTGDATFIINPETFTTASDNVSVKVTAKVDDVFSSEKTFNNIKVVEPEPTVIVSDILPEYLLTNSNNKWFNENGYSEAYVYNGNLYFQDKVSYSSLINVSITEPVTADGDNYTLTYGGRTITFNMSSNALVSISLSGSLSDRLGGTYLAPHIHSIKEEYEQVDATCEECGHSAYYECDCGAYFSDSDLTQEIDDIGIWLVEGGDGYIAPLGHNYQFSEFVWDELTAKAKYVCSNDSSHFEYHNATVTSEVTTQPTCTETGVRTYTATYDGHTDTKTEVIPATEHNFEFSEFVWDELTAKAKYICSNNALHIEYHNAAVTSAVTTNPTCTTDGVRTYTATYDGHTDTKTEVIPATGHTYEEAIWDWNENYKATATFTCAEKDDSKTIDATVTNVRTEATCTEDGKIVYTATVEFLGTKYTDTKTVVLEKLEHHYSGEVAYTWNGDQCTATWYCDHDGCTECESETVTAVYVKDTDATQKSNEFGHYEATFRNSNFTKQTTEANGVEKENTKHTGLSGGAIAGISIGLILFICLVAYVSMFFYWKKKDKALKFLIPSYKWINKTIFRNKE